MNKRGASTSLVFLVILIAIAVGLVMFAKQDSFPAQGDFAFASNIFDSNSDSNSGVFKPIDFNIPLKQPEKVTSVEAFFCPQDECAQQLVKKIDSAQKSIYIAIYSFTQADIAGALISAKERGVEVKVVFDFDQSTNSSSVDEKLIAAGIAVARRNGSGYMHNKFSIIDGNIVSTGSFNYSNNADVRNDENLIFISSEDIAAKFKSDFDHLWDASDKAS
jgi:phosphatidylserine/phosphatidylglycerophosphate/cardiolipin synthase-like enzyme